MNGWLAVRRGWSRRSSSTHVQPGECAVSRALKHSRPASDGSSQGHIVSRIVLFIFPIFLSQSGLHLDGSGICGGRRRSIASGLTPPRSCHSRRLCRSPNVSCPPRPQVTCTNNSLPSYYHHKQHPLDSCCTLSSPTPKSITNRAN